MNETNPKEKAKIQLPCELTSYEFAGMIDHTLLKHEATVEDIRKLCWEAMNYNFISVCVTGLGSASVCALGFSHEAKLHSGYLEQP